MPAARINNYRIESFGYGGVPLERYHRYDYSGNADGCLAGIRPLSRASNPRRTATNRREFRSCVLVAEKRDGMLLSLIGAVMTST